MRHSAPKLIDENFRLSGVDLKQSLGSSAYETEIARLHIQLMTIQQAYLRTRDRGIIVFEGWDAAGKGGAIRRMSAVMDPRSFKVWPIAAPSEKELGVPYLQRFWTRLPGPGEIAVFDRSWYGRVLVERVENLTAEERWRRAYDEINAFERLLVDDGYRLTKIFLHISQDEQKKRFVERLRDPLKRWKLSFEDFRNRARWAEYEEAIEEMVARTSTAAAPWRVIASNNKKYGRVAAIETIVARLSDGIDLSPRPLDAGLLEVAQEAMGIEPNEILADR